MATTFQYGPSFHFEEVDISSSAHTFAEGAEPRVICFYHTESSAQTVACRSRSASTVDVSFIIPPNVPTFIPIAPASIQTHASVTAVALY